MKAPKRLLHIGGRAIALEGNLHACLDYSQVTRGKGLEDAYKLLEPQLKTYEDEGADALNKAHPFRDPEPWALLLWGLSATWRSESGWNIENASSEDLGKPVRESSRFEQFVKPVTFSEYRAARPVLLEMLLLTLFLPDPVETKKKAGR